MIILLSREHNSVFIKFWSKEHTASGYDVATKVYPCPQCKNPNPSVTQKLSSTLQANSTSVIDSNFQYILKLNEQFWTRGSLFDSIIAIFLSFLTTK